MRVELPAEIFTSEAEIIAHYKAVQSRRPMPKAPARRKPDTFPPSTLIQAGSHQWGPWFAPERPGATRADLLKILENAPQAIPSRTGIAIKRIQIVVAAHYGMTVLDLISKRRDRRTVRARQVAVYLATKLTTLSYMQIAIQFTYIDHSVVWHGINNIAAKRKTEPGLDAALRAMTTELTGGSP